MAKKRPPEEEPELNLIPIMNLVLILIPLLLLSVVFLEIAVLDVTMPEQANAANPNDTEDEIQKRLRLFINAKGFVIEVVDGQNPNPRVLPAIDRCTGEGLTDVTVCLSNASAETLAEKYDWLGLYNRLFQLKTSGGWEEHLTVEVIAGADVTFDVLVKAMDVMRHQRGTPAGEDPCSEPSEFSDVSLFFNSKACQEDAVDEETGQTGKRNMSLFPQVILGTQQGGQ